MKVRSLVVRYAVVSALLAVAIGCDARAVGQQQRPKHTADSADAKKTRMKRPGVAVRRSVVCATNRKAKNDKDRTLQFGVQRGSLRYLRYDLTIAPKHKAGAIVDIKIDAVQPLPAWTHGKTEPSGRSRKRGKVLIFVHGFYVGHEESVKRAAQIANELDYRGRIVVFSWPSLCRFDTQAYHADRRMLDQSVTAFCRLLTDLSKRFPDDGIQVLAHSLGARLVGEAVLSLSRTAGSRRVCLADVLLASPDVGVKNFESRYAAPLLRIAKRITVLHSTCDPLLRLSKSKNNGRARLGRVGFDRKRFPKIGVIEFSKLGCTYGTHNFYREHPVLLKKLKALLCGAKNAVAGRTP